MRIDTRSSLNRAAKYIGVLFGILEQSTQVTDDLETHTLFVATGQGRCGERLGDEIGSPSSQFDVGIRTCERQDAYHDLRVVGLRVAENGFLGLVQLLELIAHGLYVGGRHDGQQESGHWVRSKWERGSGRSWSGMDLLTSTLRGLRC